MLHHMKLQSAPLKKIRCGQKTIEVRLNDPKRRLISVGDVVEFSENDYPDHQVLTRVQALLYYPTFVDLYTSHDPTLFGGESREFLLNQIRQFYSPADEEKYGVVGIRIQLIDENDESL